MRGTQAKAASARESASSPPDSEYSQGVLSWLSFAITEGLATNRSQHNYDKIGQAIDAIMGLDEPTIRSPRLSNARFNKVQKIALELRSMLTDIKPFWVYNANSARYEPQAAIFGKLARSWFMRRGIDQAFRDAIDYVLAAGTGYIHLFWDTEIDGPSDNRGRRTRGDINARAEDPRDVIPIRFSNGDKRTLQGCRGVAIRRERPTSWFKQIYSSAADDIKVDRMGMEKESPSQRRAREAEDSLTQGGGYFDGHPGFGGAPANALPGPVPITDEFTVYLHDYSVNTSGRAREMGEFIDAIDSAGRKTRESANKWSYTVEPGDALYPFGRRIVATRHGILEDGPSHFHHGMFPVCKVTLDTWAWSWLGTSPIHPLLSIQRAVDENMRGFQDAGRRRSKRGIVYDKKAVPPAVARKFDTRRAGQKLGINPHAAGAKGAVQIVEEPPFDIGQFEWFKFLLDSMDELSGTMAMKQFSQLAQVPSTETIDKIVESMTPLVRARSRAMEIFIREFAMMLASMFMQFYDLDLRLRILGEEGMVAEDFDYRPGDLLPDYINDADYEQLPATGDAAAPPRWALKQSAWDRGPEADHIRNREFLRFFDYDITPGSLLDAATITKKLLYLQLARMGIIDHWTLLETLGVANVGKPPSWATTITKRLEAERILGIGIMASTVGRPPSAQAMPSLGAHGINES